MNSLIRKTIVGFIQLHVILGIVVFLSAGSIQFWQGWVYLGVFFVCNLLLTAYFVKYDPKLVESRLNVGPIAEKEKSQKIIQTFNSFFFIGLFVIPGLDFRFHWSQVPLSAIVLADAAIVLSYVIFFFTFRENSYTSAIVKVSDEQTVISTGPYGIVRHPLYAGALLLFLFTPIALGSWWAALLFFPLTMLIVLRLLEEEKFLSEHLLGYQDYCQKTRYRLIPMVW